MVYQRLDSGAIELRWLLAIGKASLFGAGLVISMSSQLKTKNQKNFIKLSLTRMIL